MLVSLLIAGLLTAVAVFIPVDRESFREKGENEKMETKLNQMHID